MIAITSATPRTQPGADQDGRSRRRDEHLAERLRAREMQRAADIVQARRDIDDAPHRIDHDRPKRGIDDDRELRLQREIEHEKGERKKGDPWHRPQHLDRRHAVAASKAGKSQEQAQSDSDDAGNRPADQHRPQRVCDVDEELPRADEPSQCNHDAGGSREIVERDPSALDGGLPQAQHGRDRKQSRHIDPASRHYFLQLDFLELAHVLIGKPVPTHSASKDARERADGQARGQFFRDMR